MLLASGLAGGWGLIAFYILLFGGLIYFMSIRPNSKKRKEREAMNASMKAGDSVLTTSGFYGVIIDIMDNTVIVEFGNNRNCRIPMQKEAIQAVEKPDYAKTEEEE